MSEKEAKQFFSVQAIFYLFDVNKPSTFEDIKKWHKKCCEVSKTKVKHHFVASMVSRESFFLFMLSLEKTQMRLVKLQKMLLPRIVQKMISLTLYGLS